LLKYYSASAQIKKQKGKIKMKNTILSLCFTLVLASSILADDGHINETRSFAPDHTNETKSVLVVEDKGEAETNLISNIITQIYDLFNVAE
jgi:hypothetical protein